MFDSNLTNFLFFLYKNTKVITNSIPTRKIVEAQIKTNVRISSVVMAFYDSLKFLYDL